MNVKIEEIIPVIVGGVIALIIYDKIVKKHI